MNNKKTENRLMNKKIFSTDLFSIDYWKLSIGYCPMIIVY